MPAHDALGTRDKSHDLILTGDRVLRFLCRFDDPIDISTATQASKQDTGRGFAVLATTT